MRFAAVLLAVVICTPALAQRQSFPPKDEAGQDPSLVDFRAELLNRIAARDSDFVVASACPNIYLSHGSAGGPEEFRLNLTVPPETLSEEFRHEADELRDTYWADLQTTISQPGYFDDQGEFWMPHQWQITLPAALDPFTAFFVTGKDVSPAPGVDPRQRDPGPDQP